MLFYFAFTILNSRQVKSCILYSHYIFIKKKNVYIRKLTQIEKETDNTHLPFCIWDLAIKVFIGKSGWKAAPVNDLLIWRLDLSITLLTSSPQLSLLLLSLLPAGLNNLYLNQPLMLLMNKMLIWIILVRTKSLPPKVGLMIIGFKYIFPGVFGWQFPDHESNEQSLSYPYSIIV